MREHKDKARMPNPEKAIDAMATRIIERGQLGIKIDPKLGAPTDEDKRQLTRITGMSVEEFNAKFSEKLRTMADKVLERIGEHVEAGTHKPGELSFLLAILEDKRAKLDGKGSSGASQINVQVNNYGLKREDILAKLSGQTIALDGEDPI